MLNSKANLNARKERIRKLREKKPISPRRRLAVKGLVLVVIVLLAPSLIPQRSSAELAEEFDPIGSLAIDSPTFSLESIATTDDGFLIKNATSVGEVDRSGLKDIITYTVENGDMLSGIARRFGVDMDTIIWENGITDPHKLKPGAQLAILPVSGITHTVKAGDTISSIAKKYGIDAEKIAKQNQLDEDAELVASTKVIIPGGKRVMSTGTMVAANSSPGTYASYQPPKAIDGAIIIANGASDKENTWMIKPTVGKYTTYFHPGHYAVDIADVSKPDIHAAADGTVVKAQCGWNGGYGCMVVIDHADGFQTLYGHLSEIGVSVGDAVDQGDTIGIMGNTGRVYGRTGIHLHFEVIDNGVKKNPLAFYSE